MSSIKKIRTTEGDLSIDYNSLDNRPDLTDYVKNTDYATSSKGGVIKKSSVYGYDVSGDGYLLASTLSYNDYQNYSNNLNIGKGTLENVITGKQLVNQTYVDNLVGDINTAIDSINGEVI